MKLSLIERESRDNVVDIWMKYHNNRNENVAYAISKKEYQKLTDRVKQSPMFLMPVKKNENDGNHFMMIGQGQEKTFMYTFLEDFKNNQTNAQPYFVLTIFDELLDKKDIALVRGDIINYKIDKNQANMVLNYSLSSYLKDDLYNKFVYNFNHQTHEFSFDDFKSHFKLE
ncbi:hypothetical protein PPERSA_05147 [Pseudocohnilembus persalinus]|uniref:ATP11 protein n=1 Tax=Pseudocohnilembus persalinus TaxID=266149 RepID=A0A0V0QWG3_PSEPJ|nr:hypothetical protein PPERSA_05147 [Pseudocohnilembus persalinus]|eukprot:KRX06534.1 hypothetical protein PPERSA_05147 [Pseudocohnilembus persalinus]